MSYLSPSTITAFFAAVPKKAAATLDDAMAREAVAVAYEQDSDFQSAAMRRHGCDDGDESHRIALAAIRAERRRSARSFADTSVRDLGDGHFGVEL